MEYSDEECNAKAEVERLRGGVPDFGAQSKIAIAGQLANSAEVSRAINNMDQLTSIRLEEDEAKIRGASRAIKDIREKYPSGKMTVEENHGD